MAERSRSHPEIQGTAVPRVVIPGPNSWAKKSPDMKSQPTNRSKYENKPVPSLPLGSQSSSSSITTNQSAFSLDAVKPGTMQTMASTESVPPKVIKSSKPSTDIFRLVGQNRDSSRELPTAELNPHNDTDALEQAQPTDKAHRGGTPGFVERTPRQPKINRKPPAHTIASISATAGITSMHDNDYKTSSEEATDAPLTQRRYANILHDPAWLPPRAQFAPETALDFASATALLCSARQSNPENDIVQDDAEGNVLGNGSLHPTSNDSYGILGEGEYVDGNRLGRVKSCVGLIEGDETATEASSLVNYVSRPSSPHDTKISDNSLPDLFARDSYLPCQPSRTGRRCSNMGQLFSPYDPTVAQKTQFSDSRVRNCPHGSAPAVPNAPIEPDIHGFDTLRYATSVGSMSNSWASSPIDMRTAASRSEPTSSANVAPLFTQRRTGNSVPTPPHYSYQPHLGLTPPELARLELNVHHHIDTVFGSLTRLVTNQQDQLADQTIRHIEAMEKKVDKAIKIVRETRESLDFSKAETTVLLQKIHAALDNRMGKSNVAHTVSALPGDAESQWYDECNPTHEHTFRPRRSQSVLVSPTHRTPGQRDQLPLSNADYHGINNENVQRSDAAQSILVGHGKAKIARSDMKKVSCVVTNSPPDIRDHPALRESHSPPERRSPCSPNHLRDALFHAGLFHPQNHPGWYAKAFGE